MIFETNVEGAFHCIQADLPAMLEAGDGARILTDEERSEAYAASLPLRRTGRPEEIAATVAFLCSEDASFYAGQLLSPNGGAVM